MIKNMKWLLAGIVGFLLGAIVFIPSLRDVALKLVLGDALVKVCPGDEGMVLGGNYQLSKIARSEVEAICSKETYQMVQRIEAVEKTTGTEVLYHPQEFGLLIAYLEVGEHLEKTGWKLMSEGEQDGAQGYDYRLGNRRVLIRHGQIQQEDGGGDLLVITHN